MLVRAAHLALLVRLRLERAGNRVSYREGALQGEPAVRHELHERRNVRLEHEPAPEDQPPPQHRGHELQQVVLRHEDLEKERLGLVEARKRTALDHLNVVHGRRDLLYRLREKRK